MRSRSHANVLRRSDPAEVEHIRNETKKRLKDSLGVNIEVNIAEPDTVPRSEGKAVRIKGTKSRMVSKI